MSSQHNTTIASVNTSLVNNNDITLVLSKTELARDLSTSPSNSLVSSKSSLKTTNTIASNTTTSSSLINYLKNVQFNNSRSPLVCTPASNISSIHNNSTTHSPIVFSRASSFQSLNSYNDDLKHSINSSIPSDYSRSCIQSGIQSPLANRYSYDSTELKSNEITIVEKSTCTNNTITNTTATTTALNEENTVLYETEKYKKSDHDDDDDDDTHSDISSLSIIKEDNKLRLISNDLNEIYKLLNMSNNEVATKMNKQLNQVVVMPFTPPTKLNKADDCDERKVLEHDENALSPVYSELSIPSVIKEDLKQQNSVDFNLLNKKLNPIDINKEEEEEVVVQYNDEDVLKPSNTPVCYLNVSNESLNNTSTASSRHSTSKDDSENDDGKILLDFINKMLPNVVHKRCVENKKKVLFNLDHENVDSKVKSTTFQRKITSAASGSSGGSTSTPIVAMTKTTQLRVNKAHQLKLEMNSNNSNNSNKFKTPLTPVKSYFKPKSSLKRV